MLSQCRRVLTGSELLVSRILLVLCFFGAVAVIAAPAEAIPLFARRYGVSCNTCHVHPPKLNAFGEKFAAQGYRAEELGAGKPTFPLAVWTSGLTQNAPQNTDVYRSVPNRVEIIAAGRLEALRSSYFIEWRTLSKEFPSATTIRDRSGRFEDLYLAYDLSPRLQFWAGQYRALTQVDVSRRLSVSEPLVFSQSLPGPKASNDRRTGLRGFAPSGRAPSVRLLGVVPDNEGSVNGWYGVATVPLAGEFSLPLGSEARRNASFEFEDTAKGVFLEAYRRHDLSSLGINYFTGSEQRRYLGLVATHNWRNFYATAGAARAHFGAKQDWRYSAELEYIPVSRAAFGVRVDHRTNVLDPNTKTAVEPLLIPYVSVQGPGTQWTSKFVIEGRLRKKQKPQAVFEYSLIF